MTDTKDKTTSVILGLKGELKLLRTKLRDADGRLDRWQSVAQSLRKLAGINDEQFANLLRSESLTE